MTFKKIVLILIGFGVVIGAFASSFAFASSVEEKIKNSWQNLQSSYDKNNQERYEAINSFADRLKNPLKKAVRGNSASFDISFLDFFGKVAEKIEEFKKEIDFSYSPPKNKSFHPAGVYSFGKFSTEPVKERLVENLETTYKKSVEENKGIGFTFKKAVENSWRSLKPSYENSQETYKALDSFTEKIKNPPQETVQGNPISFNVNPSEFFSNVSEKISGVAGKINDLKNLPVFNKNFIRADLFNSSGFFSFGKFSTEPVKNRLESNLENLQSTYQKSVEENKAVVDSFVENLKKPAGSVADSKTFSQSVDEHFKNILGGFNNFQRILSNTIISPLFTRPALEVRIFTQGGAPSVAPIVQPGKTVTITQLADTTALQNSLEELKKKQSSDSQALFNMIANTNRINQLNNVVLSNPTFSPALSDSDIPDTITVSNYLSLGGGSLTGKLGIGTTTPAKLLSVGGDALIDGTLTLTNLIATGTTAFNGVTYTWPSVNGAGGDVLLTNGSGVLSWGVGGALADWVKETTYGTLSLTPSTTIPIWAKTDIYASSSLIVDNRFSVGTSSNQYAFAVSTSSIAFNADNNGDFIGAWATTSSLLTAAGRFSSIAANGYVYMFGGTTDGGTTYVTSVSYAKINSDGTLGAWQVGNPMPMVSGRGSHSSVFANGYVYVIGGLPSTSAYTSRGVYYAKLNSDGSVGAWQTSNSVLPTNTSQHTSVVANGYVYVFGGYDGSSYQNTVYYAKLNSDGSIGPWATNANSLTLARYRHTSVAANGYVYVIGGGNSGTMRTTVYYAKLNTDGSVGTWSTTTALPAGRGFASSVISNGYIYVVGGAVSSADQSTIYYAKLNNDGTVGAWSTSINSLPSARGEHASVAANGYVYVIGGTSDNSTTYMTSVFYDSLPRTSFATNLDLLGLASTSLADVNVSNSSFGSVGASIFAGNIFSAGSLEVTGNTMLWNGLGVNGNLTINASTSQRQNTSIFSIQNATGTSPILSVLYSGKIGIGTSTPNWLMQLAGARPFLTLSDTNGAANLKHWTLSSQGGNFYIATSSDVFATSSLSALTISSNSLFGLGTTTPSANYRLSVQGSILGSGTIDLTGSTGTSTFALGQGLVFGINQFVIEQTSGNVGVGTSSPSADFAVQGNALISGDIASVANITATGTLSLTGTSGTSTIASGQGFTIGTSQLVLQQGSGRLGIGTTTPMWLIQLSGTRPFLTLSDSNGGTDLKHWTLSSQGGNFYIATSSDDFATSSVPALTIDSNGFIGIGTSTPSQQFSISGGILSSGTLTANLLSLTGTSGTSTIALGQGLVFGTNQFIIEQTSGKIGIGTTSPSANLSVQGNALISGDIASVANITATGTLSLTGTSGTSTIAKGQSLVIGTDQLVVDGSSGKVGIGTSSPSVYGFAVATNTIAFNAGNTGEFTGPWSTGNSLPTVLDYAQHGVAANGYVYILGGYNGASYLPTVRYAKLNSDGSVGAWSTTSSMPVALLNTCNFVFNGYIYAISGQLDGGAASAGVYYAKINNDGTLSSWSTAINSLPAARDQASSAVSNGYVYVMGGSGGATTVYYAKLNSDGSVGAWSTGTALPLTRTSASSVASNGYVYVIGGGATTVYYAKLNSDGSVGAWSTGTALPLTRTSASSIVSNGYIYVIGGAGATTVYYAKLNSDGSVGAWSTSVYSLPAVKTNHTSVVANGYVYAIGGGSTNTVFYASLPRTSFATNLDLLGLTSTSLADVNGDGTLGSIGSSIFAGNIFSAGSLEVTGNTMLWNGLGVNGNLTINASTSQQQNTSIFTIQNATGTAPILSALYNGKIGIGTSTPNWLMQLAGTRPFLVLSDMNSNGNLKHWTLSSQGGNFYIATSSDALATSTTPALAINSNGGLTINGILTSLSTTGTSTFAKGQGLTFGTDQFVIEQTSGRVGFGTSSPSTYGFAVATNTIAFNSGNTGELAGPWKTTSNLPTTVGYGASVIVNGYIYSIGNYNGSYSSAVYSAKLNGDGTVGSWSANTSLPTVLITSAVTANGYIYVLGGDPNNPGHTSAIVYYAKVLSDGKLGAWNITSSLPAAYVALNGAAVINGYIVIPGGGGASIFSSVWSAKINSDGTLGAWKTTTSLPLAQKGVVIATNNYVYTLGGVDEASVATTSVRYAPVDNDGNVGTWKSANSLPVAIQFHGAVLQNGYVYITGGSTGSENTSVFYAKLNNDGTLGSWATSIYTVSPTILTMTGVAAANGFLYILGGTTGGGPPASSVVRYAPLATTYFATNINLLGLASTSLSSGDFGSIFAGNIFSGGSLEVEGSAMLWNGLGVNGSLSINASTSLQQNTSIFSIRNATGTAPILSALYNGKIGIGTSTPNWLMQLAGARPFLTLSDTNGAANLKHWTLSSQGGNFYIATSSDAFATSSVPALTIDSNGLFGFGTSSPTQLLTVQGNVLITGTTKLNGITYTWPSADGSNGQMLTTSGAGVLTWTTAAGGGGALADWLKETTYGTLSLTPSTTIPIWAKSAIYASSTLTLDGTLRVGTSSLTIIGETGRVGIGTSSPSTYGFAVATNTIAFNSGNTGEFTGPWATTSVLLPNNPEAFVTIAATGYVYAIGGTNGAVNYNTVYYSKVNSDGTLGSWITNTPLPDYRVYASGVIVNGYIYVIGGYNNVGVRQATVYYAKVNTDGSTSAWSTTTALPVAMHSHSSVTANGYVYVMGGNTAGGVVSTVYYAKISSDGTLGSWQTSANSLLTIRELFSAVVNNGYIYAIGGSTNLATQTSTVYYAKVNTDGSTSAWSTTTALPSIRGYQTTIVSNGYIYEIGGTQANGNDPRTTIFYAPLNNNGTVGSWSTSTFPLPAKRQGHGSFTANGYVYAIGGLDGATRFSTTFYASFPRTSFATNLDLLGFSSTTLGEANGGGTQGSVGSSIFAGNIFSAGILEVTGNAQLWGGLGVNGNLSVNASTSLQQNTSIFSINNATGSAPIITALYNGNVGIGTSAPTQLFSVGMASNLFTINGTTGRVGIGTSSPSVYGFSVATNTIAFNPSNNGEFVGPWASTIPLPAARGMGGAVVVNGYVYMIGGSTSGSNAVATSYYAKLNSDGTVRAWNTTTPLPGNRWAGTASAGNGYIYFMGGHDGGDAQVTTYYAKVNNDGTLGAWSTGTALPEKRYALTSAVANGYLYAINGATPTANGKTTVYYAKLNSDGSFGAWTTATSAIGRSEHASVVANGYMYTIGGFSDYQTVSYAKMNSDGSFGTWSTTTALPTADYGDPYAVATNGYMYVIGNNTSTVRYAKLNSNGTIGAWTTSVYALPAIRTWAMSVVANGYVYVIGGSAVDTVYYASLPRTSFATNLDLLGLSSTTLTDVNGDGYQGSVGSSIYAGNIYSAGALEVAGNSQFWNGVGVSGLLSVTASTSFNQATPIFSVQNATGTAPVLTVLYNGNVGINKAVPVSALDIVGTCADTGGGCADVAELYPSAEDVEPGDILGFYIDGAGFVKKADNRNLLVGVVSSRPAVLIEGSSLQMLSGANYKSQPRKPAVALSGRVPVKINLEGGDINVGDPITVSSVPGIGAKAVTSGQIVGYALEKYTSQSTTSPKIMVFTHLGYWDEVASSTPSFNANENLLAAIISTVKDWLNQMGVVIENGLMTVKSFFAENMQVGTQSQPSGITIFDKATGQPYCIAIENGQMRNTEGVCGSQPGSVNNNPVSTTTPDTEPPVIHLNGPALIELEKGTAWGDPGATVTDNVNTNLGVYFKVNGVDVQQVSIDTNVLGTYIITYTSTDQAGNVGTAQREVDVIDSSVATTTPP